MMPSSGYYNPVLEHTWIHRGTQTHHGFASSTFLKWTSQTTVIARLVSGTLESSSWGCLLAQIPFVHILLDGPSLAWPWNVLGSPGRAGGDVSGKFGLFCSDEHLRDPGPTKTEEMDGTPVPVPFFFFLKQNLNQISISLTYTLTRMNKKS